MPSVGEADEHHPTPGKTRRRKYRKRDDGQQTSVTGADAKLATGARDPADSALGDDWSLASTDKAKGSFAEV